MKFEFMVISISKCIRDLLFSLFCIFYIKSIADCRKIILAAFALKGIFVSMYSYKPALQSLARLPLIRFEQCSITLQHEMYNLVHFLTCLRVMVIHLRLRIALIFMLV